MKVIPVLDLKGGVAVHAIRGERDRYAPVQSCLCESADPERLACTFRDVLGLGDLYVADLDAIGGSEPAWDVLRALCDTGLKVWADVGLRDDIQPAKRLLECGVENVIAALETVPGPDALLALFMTCGPDRIVFSVDLNNGVPLGDQDAWNHRDPIELITTATTVGLRQFIVLDLARVGAGGGTGTEALAGTIQACFPSVALTVGGGVQGIEDLQSWNRSGVDGVLVASALHDGRIGRESLELLLNSE